MAWEKERPPHPFAFLNVLPPQLAPTDSPAPLHSVCPQQADPAEPPNEAPELLLQWLPDLGQLSFARLSMGSGDGDGSSRLSSPLAQPTAKRPRLS